MPIFFRILLSASLCAPSVVFAGSSNLTFAALLKSVVGFIYGSLIPVLGSALVLVFLYGVFKFVLAAGDTGSHEEGKKFMMYGIIGLVVAFSLWSLIYILQEIFFGGTPLKDGGVGVMNSYFFGETNEQHYLRGGEGP